MRASYCYAVVLPAHSGLELPQESKKPMTVGLAMEDLG
jgi:hypothetical protein